LSASFGVSVFASSGVMGLASRLLGATGEIYNSGAGSTVLNTNDLTFTIDSFSAGTGVPAVPLPGSLWLLASGLCLSGRPRPAARSQARRLKSNVNAFVPGGARRLTWRLLLGLQRAQVRITAFLLEETMIFLRIQIIPVVELLYIDQIHWRPRMTPFPVLKGDVHPGAGYQVLEVDIAMVSTPNVRSADDHQVAQVDLPLEQARVLEQRDEFVEACGIASDPGIRLAKEPVSVEH
jgi:hypothetical protein